MAAASTLPEDVVGFTGIYDADGGLRGEVAYVVGHLLGRAEFRLTPDMIDGRLSEILGMPVRDRTKASFPAPQAPTGQPPVKLS